MPENMSETDLIVDAFEKTPGLHVNIMFSDENGNRGYCSEPKDKPGFWLNNLPNLKEAICHAEKFEWLYSVKEKL